MSLHEPSSERSSQQLNSNPMNNNSRASKPMNRRRSMGDDDNSLRYSINLDKGGMDAIMGCLYKDNMESTRSLHNERYNKRSSNSFCEPRGEPSDSVGGKGKRRSVHGETSDRGDTKRSSRSFHGEPSGGHIPRRRSVRSFYQPRPRLCKLSRPEPMAEALSDRSPSPASEAPDRKPSNEKTKPSTEQPSKPRRPIRRRATIESVSVSEASLDESHRSNRGNNDDKHQSFHKSGDRNFRRSTGNVDDPFNMQPSTLPSTRRVSWSNLHSISLIDINKSPDHMAKMDCAWQDATFPPLPLSADGGPSRGSSVGSEGDSLGGLSGFVGLKPPAEQGGVDMQGGHQHQSHQDQARQLRRPQAQQQQNHSQANQANPQVNESNPQQCPSTPTTRVISLPWTDHRGIRGEYTGEVNSSIQPHGSGTFTMHDGSSMSCTPSTWMNGMMITAKVPVGVPLGSRVDDTTRLFRRGDSTGTTGTDCTARTEAPGESSSGSPRNSSPSNDQDSEGDVGLDYSPTPTLKSCVSATSLPGYHLGHTAKHRSHMIIPPNSKTAIKHAFTLKSLDFAFVLRSNGGWTYSIVADRPFSEDGPAIRFVLDGRGSTKTIRKKYWGRGIRLVNNGLIDRDGNITEEANEQGGAHGNGVENDKGNDKGDRENDHQGHAYSRQDLERDMEAKVGKKKVKRHLEREPSRQSINSEQGVVEDVNPSSTVDPLASKDPISKKMNRRKSAPDSCQQSMIYMSFTSDKAVNGSFDNGSPSRGFDKHHAASGESSIPEKAGPEKKLGGSKSCSKSLDESGQSGSSFGLNLQAMLSLDYIGLLDDTSNEEESESLRDASMQAQQQQPRKSKPFYGDVSMQTDYGDAPMQTQQQQQQQPKKSKSFYEDASMQRDSNYYYAVEGGQQIRKSKSCHHGDASTSRQHHHKDKHQRKSKSSSSKSHHRGDSSKSSHPNSSSHSSRGSNDYLPEGITKSSSSHSSLHSTSERGILKSSSSFHAISWEEVERRTRDQSKRRGSNASLPNLFFGDIDVDDEEGHKAPSRRGSNASLQNMVLPEDLVRGNKKGKMKRRGSTSSRGSMSECSMGTNVTNLSSLLREIYSPQYLERA